MTPAPPASQPCSGPAQRRAARLRPCRLLAQPGSCQATAFRRPAPFSAEPAAGKAQRSAAQRTPSEISHRSPGAACDDCQAVNKPPAAGPRLQGRRRVDGSGRLTSSTARTLPLQATCRGRTAGAHPLATNASAVGPVRTRTACSSCSVCESRILHRRRRQCIVLSLAAAPLTQGINQVAPRGEEQHRDPFHSSSNTDKGLVPAAHSAPNRIPHLHDPRGIRHLSSSLCHGYCRSIGRPCRGVASRSTPPWPATGPQPWRLSPYPRAFCSTLQRRTGLAESCP